MKHFFFLVATVSAISLSAQHLPKSFWGSWEGELQVVQGNIVRQTVDLSLVIESLSDSTYTWLLKYETQDTSDVRPYTLMRQDSLGMHWAIDEHNGIVLDAYLHQHVLYSQFSVLGNLLVTRDEVKGDTLFHEIISGRLDPVRTSGGTPQQGEDIPVVESFSVLSRQYAKLIRRQGDQTGED